MIPIHVNKLELEMTRLCNGKCRHCMRGHEQNISLSKNIIDNIFRKDNYKIVHISYLFLTGGEVLINKENTTINDDLVLTYLGLKKAINNYDLSFTCAK